jgi:hypothetical protein
MEPYLLEKIPEKSLILENPRKASRNLEKDETNSINNNL